MGINSDTYCRLVWIRARKVHYLPYYWSAHVSLLGGAGTHCLHSSRAHEPGGVTAMWNSTHRLGLSMQYIFMAVQVGLGTIPGLLADAQCALPSEGIVQGLGCIHLLL